MEKLDEPIKTQLATGLIKLVKPIAYENREPFKRLFLIAYSIYSDIDGALHDGLNKPFNNNKKWKTSR